MALDAEMDAMLRAASEVALVVNNPKGRHTGKELDQLSAAQAQTVKRTLKAALLRSAKVVAAITSDDVLAMQRNLLAAGLPMSKVCHLDRADVAAAHLRACAELED